MTELAIFHHTARPNNFPSQLGATSSRCPSFLPVYFSPLFLPTFRPPPPQRQIFWLISFSSLDRISISWWASQDGWRKSRERRAGADVEEAKREEEKKRRRHCAPDRRVGRRGWRAANRSGFLFGKTKYRGEDSVTEGASEKEARFLAIPLLPSPRNTDETRAPLLPPQRRPIDILALRALVVLLPRRATGASIISVTGIGESSSIKGPISDDKDLEMNGPRHSNGSLSSCPTARFSAIPPLPLRKQSCFELLITLWRIRANNYGQVLTTHPSWFRRRILVLPISHLSGPIKVNEGIIVLGKIARVGLDLGLAFERY